MSRSTLVGAAVVTPTEVRSDCAIVIEDGKIVSLVPRAEAATLGSLVRLDGGYLVAGFIDIQVNGGGGVLFNDDISVDGIRAIAQAHRRFGTTLLLPTLISDTPGAIEGAIAAVDQAIDLGVPGIAGVHVEGPYLNPVKRGIHDASKIAPVNEAGLELLTRSSRGIRLVTLAPELCPKGTIRRLREAGVIVCAGHSLADYQKTHDALGEGLDGFTHLF